MKPEEIEALGYGNEVIWQNLEQEIMNDVARRIKETGVVTRSADFQLNQIQKIYGYSDETIKELLKEAMRASDAYIDRVYDEAIRTDYIDNKDLYKAKGKAFVPFEKNESMQSLVRTLKMQSKREMENFSRSLGFVIGKTPVNLTAYYQSVLDDAILQIASGGFDSKTALKKAVSDMTNSGIRWIDYESGHHNRVTVAARRSITTGLSQMTQKISEYNAAQLGTEYFEVAWHANARPTHREWHGQVWSKQELETVCGLGTVEGLCGANCYHVYYPFIKGLSKRNWNDEWLQEQNAKEDTPITFNGKEYTGYEATQRQRVLETRMRAQREAIQALQAGDGDELDIMFMQAKYRASMDEYVRFSKAMGLREQRDRVYVDGLGKRGSKLSPKNLNRRVNLMKGYRQAIEKGDISSFVTFDIYDAVAKEIEQKLVGLRTKDGIIIAGYKTHFIDRIIGQYESSNEPIKGKRKGVSLSQAKDTLQNGKVKDMPAKKNGKASRRYITDDCFVTLNPDTKELIQATPKNRKG